MDLKEIKTLIDLMKKNDLSVFKMEKDDFKITLKKGHDGQVMSYAMPAPLPAAGSAPAPAAGGVPAPVAGAPDENLREIVSPMVGTFYESPSPESPSFVKVGQQVTEETVVCIVEAMKVMNEIKAEAKGEIVEMLAESGKPVQFGQPLFRLR